MLYFDALWSRRELLWFWILREIRARYKQSFLGVGWAILQPAALTVVTTLVFSRLARLPSDGLPYPLFAYVALVPWTFLATSISQGVPSIVGQMGLVTKSSFPREILPLGVIGAAFIDFLSAFVVLCLMLVFYRVSLTIYMLWLPLLVLMQFMLTAGVVFVGATLNVFYRDIRFAVPLVMQVWMYATPIVYSLSLVPERWRGLYALNPMVGLIESYRNILVRGSEPAWELLGIGVVSSFLLLVVGYFVFKRAEPTFADLI